MSVTNAVEKNNSFFPSTDLYSFGMLFKSITILSLTLNKRYFRLRLPP